MVEGVYPGYLNLLLVNLSSWLTPVHEKDLVFWFGLRFRDEEVIRASEFSKSTRPRSQTRHTAQTVTPIPGNENSDALTTSNIAPYTPEPERQVFLMS